ncbi:hypothetical protein Q664_34220 [Archangium violaceum Cb vi76]|uniref:Uncharacterized protein n=1 Tax=Archangium violaceum Cb vi76 TaxID=1406225 RepID=A0A084SLV6_9BACT|nr:hypothetical protein Q664_34220 [Archangium violaceum Cb vi76]
MSASTKAIKRFLQFSQQIRLSELNSGLIRASQHLTCLLLITTPDQAEAMVPVCPDDPCSIAKSDIDTPCFFVQLIGIVVMVCIGSNISEMQGHERLPQSITHRLV